MSLATVTVAGTITAPDGTPFARKTVWFTTTAEMVDAAGNVLYPITRIQARVITGELKAADGTSPLVLVDSDAGLGTVPYVIEESWANGRKFTVNLTASMAVSGHIPYSTLGPVTPPPTAVGPFALLSDVETRDAATLTAAEAYTDAHSGGAVSSVFGRAGTVTAQSGDYTKAQVGLGNVDNTADSAKVFAESQVTGLVTDLAAKAPVTTTTIDLVDRTNNTTETVPAGTTTNCSTAGVTKTAPALDNPVATPPKRFAVKNLSAGNITVAYPDQAGAAQSLSVLPAETRTFRQKTTSGWGVESGAIAISTLDGRFLPPTYTLAGRPAATGSKTVIWVSDASGGQLQQDTATGVWTPLAPGVSQGNLGLVTSASVTGNTPAAGTTSTTDIDLTGLSVTFTAAASAQYELRLASNGPGNLTVDAKTNLSICDSSNNRLQFVAQPCHTVSTGYSVFLVAQVTPGAGSVTYKARISAVTGTAFITALASAPTILSAYRIA